MPTGTVPPVGGYSAGRGRNSGWQQHRMGGQQRIRGIEDVISLFQGVQKLPTLPALAVRAMRVIEDSDSSARDLSLVLSQDQAASARILRVANSAFYASQRKTTTVREAIVMLGFSSVRSLVLTSQVISLFGGGSGSNFDRDLFWEHSVACGVAAETLAVRLRLKRPDEAFTAGILHDIGKIVLDQYMHEEFRQILGLMASEGLPAWVAEEQVIGTNHAAVGGVMARLWDLPLALVEAISYHHTPASIAEPRETTLLVALCDAYCFEHQVYSGVEEPAPEGLELIAWRLGLNRKAVSDALEPFERIEARAREFVSSSQI